MKGSMQWQRVVLMLMHFIYKQLFIQDVLTVAGEVLEEVQADLSLFTDPMEVIRKLKQTKEVLVK